MNGEARRHELLTLITSSSNPLSGTVLASKLAVSRQVIVQDIALLRSAGHDIISTSRGYILMANEPACIRVFKVKHSEEQTEEELYLFVDHGAKVRDIFIYHKIYGIIKAPLNLSSRLDVQQYISCIKTGKSRLLSSATSGYHYHTIEAPSVEILNLIQERLTERGFLAKLTDYEPLKF